MIRFKDFLVMCANSEMLHVYFNGKLVATGLCEDFISNEILQDKTVNTFFSWCDGEKEDGILKTYCEVYVF